MEKAVEDGGASVRDLVTAEEWQVRVDLAACYRLIARQGWDDLIYTHVSARVPGPDEHYLINPFGLHFHEITASSLVKVDTKCKVVLESPYPVNPAAFIIHGAVHRARRADAGCVLHLHPPAVVGVATRKTRPVPLTPHPMPSPRTLRDPHPAGCGGGHNPERPAHLR